MSNSSAEIALYSTVWTAMTLFIVGEAGKAHPSRIGTAVGWRWMVSAIGASLLAVHIALALQVRHGWSHSSVVATVREQTRTTYGVDWGGGVWVNYLFLSLWIVELAWWRAASRRYFNRPRPVIVAMRGFFALVFVNAAVVFAAPSRRPLGFLMAVVLFWAWRSTFSRATARGQRASMA